MRKWRGWRALGDGVVLSPAGCFMPPRPRLFRRGPAPEDKPPADHEILLYQPCTVEQELQYYAFIRFVEGRRRAARLARRKKGAADGA